MITNFETDKVYLSKDLLCKAYIEPSRNLHNVFFNHDIANGLLVKTDSPLHIWARDYMPVQVSKKKMIRFSYNPDYLKDEPEYKPDTSAILEELGINQLNVIDSDIILDGGNVISCGDKVIMTDKIFKENPHYSRTGLIHKLSDLLEAELVLIPWDKYEEYGHADGMVRYMGEGMVLINNYCDFDKSLRSRLLDALSPHFKVKELQYGSYTKNSWAYLNFLHVGKHIFVPMLSEELDDIAFNQIAEAFPSCECHKVFQMEQVVKDGGALNCITWNVCEKIPILVESLYPTKKAYFRYEGKTFFANMVKNFYHDDEGIYAFNSYGDRTSIFLIHGDLCNACSTYSFMMMLILNQKIVKDDLVVRYKSKGNEFVEKVRSTFLKSLLGNGKIIEFLISIKNKLLKSQIDINVEVYTTIKGCKHNTISRYELATIIEHHLALNRPVQISCYVIGSQINHSLVIIGYNRVKSDVLLFYCLDPSSPLEKDQLSNCTVRFYYNEEHCDKMLYFNGLEDYADVGEALIVIPDKPLFEYPF